MPINGYPNNSNVIRSASILDSTEKPFCPPQLASIAPAISMLGIPFDNVTLMEALTRIESMIASRRPHYVVTANVDFLVQARSDDELRNVLLDAHLVICDGTPLVWASRLLKNPLPERVAGADLVPRLIASAAERKYRLFFLGATRGANKRAVSNLRKQFPDLRIVGYYSPPFRPLSQMNHAKIMRRIRAARPDLLLVAFGCPKAEKWMARHYQALGVPVMIGVGATIDFLAGHVKRAPVWMQRGGVEWLFRLGLEPKRLVRRYARDLRCFTSSMMRQWWQTRFRGSAKSDQPRHCVVSADGDWLRVQVPEQLDLETVRFGEWVWQRATRCHCIVDLGKVRFMDSTGVALLLRLRKELRRASKRLVLLGPNPGIVRLLKSMRLFDSFLVANDAAEAGELQNAGVKSNTGFVTERGVVPLRRSNTPAKMPGLPLANEAHSADVLVEDAE